MNDPSRFEGNGISYKAKLIGIEDVKDARGDAMCQEALVKLKNSVKISGEHKRKIFINVTLEGLKIIDAISLVRIILIKNKVNASLSFQEMMLKLSCLVFAVMHDITSTVL